jgi:hypothetical protein
MVLFLVFVAAFVPAVTAGANCHAHDIRRFIDTTDVLPLLTSTCCSVFS